jgi:hypothetical protein
MTAAVSLWVAVPMIMRAVLVMLLAAVYAGRVVGARRRCQWSRCVLNRHLDRGAR